MAKKSRNQDKTDRTLQAPELSRAYRLGADEQPPSRVDAAILAQARKAVRTSAPFSGRWSVPLSTAAVIVLSVALVVFMARETPLQERALLDSATRENAQSESKVKADREDKPREQTSTFTPAPPTSADNRAEAKKESSAPAAAPAVVVPASPARGRANDVAGDTAEALAESPQASGERSARLMAKQAVRTIDLQVGDSAVKAEIALTSAELERGLMYRDSLASNTGMLFIFPARESEVCMWMKDTRIPLSAAFIDRNGKVLNIADMHPLTTTVHCAEGKARFVLEMDQGAFATAGVKRGSRIGGLPSLPN